MRTEIKSPSCDFHLLRRPNRGPQSLPRDTARDRERIESAARELVAERGGEVTLFEIVQRAVAPVESGRADRRSTIHALLARRLSEIVELGVSPGDSAAELDGAPPWLIELRAILPERLRSRTASLGDVARHLAMSSRTLQRRLGEIDTTWRSELDAVRRELAVELSRTGESSETIADRLGYSDTRVLRRAARRWKSSAEH